MYQVFDISDNQPEVYEQLGTKPKFWYRGEDGREYLFKENYQNSGEHWAEKISCELCDLIGLPHAKYELATYKNKKGVISPNFKPDGGRLIHGNELLLDRKERYPVTKFYRVKEHTLDLVMRTISVTRAEPPIDWIKTDTIKRGIDIFIGYLMLDAWIANQDRHHENWGLLLTKERTIHLAPSYDHASCLGRNENDEKRTHILNVVGRDGRNIIHSYIERAKSAFFTSENSKRLKTLEAFEQAAEKNRAAGKYWIKQLSTVSDENVQSVCDSIPKTEISETAIRFAATILKLNKNRLLEIGNRL